MRIPLSLLIVLIMTHGNAHIFIFAENEQKLLQKVLILCKIQNDHLLHHDVFNWEYFISKFRHISVASDKK